MKKIYLTAISAAIITTGCTKTDPPGPYPSEFMPVLARITAVDYRPAPGQFVNETPEYEPGDTQQTMNKKAMDCLNNGDLISLGACGGYVVITLEKPIYPNPAGYPDFRVIGNAYFVGDPAKQVGSSEPGFVWVMEDLNGNGAPDDNAWILMSSPMAKSKTTQTITYTPEPNPTPDYWVYWESEGRSGYLTCNKAYHDHSYFPQWLENKTSFTVTADMIRPNGFFDQNTGQYYQECLAGFADAWPNNDPRSAFSIANSLPEGVELPKTIKFIKIATAVLQANGPLGECSTEVGGIQLLHQ